MRVSRLGRILPAALAAALCLLAAAASRAQGQPVPARRIEAGAPFPAMKLKALMPETDGLAPLDLGATLGRLPLVVCYLSLGDALGEEVLVELGGLAQGELKGKVAVLGAIRTGARMPLQKAAERLSLLGAGVPVVVEEEFALGAALGASSSPSVSLIDAAGELRIRDARSLRQTVAAGVTLRAAIESAARRGPLPTVDRLGRYYPVTELVGRPFPDFILGRFRSQERVKLSEVVAGDGRGGKVTALFFWHPNCRHCKTALPGILAGYASSRKYLELLSVVDLRNDDEARNCDDAIRAHGIVFPVLQDEGRRVGELYKIVSTPTMVFLRPDGTVDSAYTSGDTNYLPVFEKKIQTILGVEAGRAKIRPSTKG